MTFSPELRILFPQKQEIVLYPNPSASKITFELREQLGEMALEVYDLSGRVVLKSLPEANIFTIDIESLPPGIYAYRLKNGTSVLSGKFVKVP